jgi:hypothetical protein
VGFWYAHKKGFTGGRGVYGPGSKRPFRSTLREYDVVQSSIWMTYEQYSIFFDFLFFFTLEALDIDVGHLGSKLVCAIAYLYRKIKKKKSPTPIPSYQAQRQDTNHPDS